MSKLVILSSPSGTGKSTLAKNMALALHSQNKICHIISTDNYWIRPDGYYSWNVKEIEAAHNWNFEKFKNLVTDEDFNRVDCTVIIDNTNLRFSEFQRYVELALRSNWEVEIVRLPCPFTDEELFHRNVHRVTVETIHRQRERWQSLEEMNNQLERLRSNCNVGQQTTN